jgi:predicted metalloprotease with PDZ domain
VRGAHLDTTHGFFNGSSVYLCVLGREEESVTVDINAPTDRRHSAADWRVATTLPRDGATEWGFGRFRAEDYAELIDHPVEMGKFDLIEFKVAGTPHYFVLSGQHYCESERLAQDAALICKAQVDLMGELPQMERYLFLTRVEGAGYGGLEHRACCALVCARDSLPMGDATLKEGYRKFLGLVSHEYFHLWNIKRIKPAVFTPYELEGESYTELLWVFEGITSYYDDLAMVRSGVIDEASYAVLLSEIITRVRVNAGHAYQTLAESSFDAWIKFYKPDENTPNAVVSYYTKGALIALALDLTLRKLGDKTLDDVMRAMWEQYGKLDIGVPEDGFEKLAEQVSGLHLRPFFDTMVRGVEEPDFDLLFERMGWKLSEAPVANAPVTSLGVTFEPATTRLKTVNRDSCAEHAGLAAGDTLVAINSLQVKANEHWKALLPFTAGDRVSVHAFRRDELMHFEVTLDKRRATQWKISPMNEATDKANARRARWLHIEAGKSNAPTR